MKVIAVIGPTASGKSDFAVELALKENGEVISADSRQIYRGLDIGTGKITKEEMKGVPHHMLDVKDIGEPFSVSEYVEMTLPVIKDIIARGKTPIICGGTGQYVHALLYESTFPRVMPNQKLREKLEQKSNEELYAMLLKKDKERAETIDKNNKVRLVRALEILDSLPFVPKLNQSPRFSFHVYNLSITNELMKERIIRRVEKRLEQGMLDEVKSVLSLQLKDTELARCGIEYVELKKYIDGTCTLEKAKESLIAKIYQYAKRQKSWNKKYFNDAEQIEVKN